MNLKEFAYGFIDGFTIIPRFYRDIPYFQNELTSYKAGTILGGLSIGTLTGYLSYKAFSPTVLITDDVNVLAAAMIEDFHRVISTKDLIFEACWKSPLLSTSIIAVSESLFNLASSQFISFINNLLSNEILRVTYSDNGNASIGYNYSNEENITVSGDIDNCLTI